MKVLAVIDMQNDFIDGALGSAEAEAIVPNAVKKIREFEGLVVLTRDTHGENYLQTQEGRNLPVPHCIKDSDGWQINSKIIEAAQAQAAAQSEVFEDENGEAVMEMEYEPVIFDKPTFGSTALGQALAMGAQEEPVESVEIIGLCTDICVISNAMLIKACLPETEIIIDASCCAGVTPESHAQALGAMKACQIKVINE